MDKPLYVGTHNAIVLEIVGDASPLCYGGVGNPVYPLFISADLGTFTEFQELSWEVGINEFAYLDWNTNYPYPLGKEIKKALRSKNSKLSKSYLEKFYSRVRGHLLEDQALVKIFHDIFIKREGHSLSSEPEDFMDKINSMLRANTDVVLNNNVFDLFGHNEEMSLMEKAAGVKEWNKARKEQSYRSLHEGLWLTDKAKKTFERLLRDNRRKQKYFPALDWAFQFTSIPARCLMEMISLMQDQKVPQSCAHCGKYFVPSHGRDKYCERIAPGFQWGPDSKRCDEIGAQKKYWGSRSEDDLDFIKQRKSFQNRLLYLARVGKNREYQKVKVEFEDWKKKYKGGKDGKKRTTRQRTRSIVTVGKKD